MAPPPVRVLVTGAAGKTGEIALRKMASMTDQLDASGTARTEASAALVKQKTGASCKVCNLTEPQGMDAALKGVQTLVILSSATPKPNYLKLLGVMCRKFCLCDKETPIGTAFEYPSEGMPQQVDWEGTRELIDSAKRMSVQHVVLVGSMGGTKPDHFLNKMGNGNILLWKRKAEMYLQSSGLKYTIIHPGGLLPHRGTKVVPGGERELIVGVDDALMDRKSRCIPREDVADVVVQCVLEPETAAGRSFDIVANEPEEGKGWDRNLKTLLTGLGGQNCDYAGPKHPILQS
eukprot:TRINITY_DN24914_c0_g2_i1.p1 TRINITY_DN24914_c0_g2~~TRINITY_DN24914_c0_g2_i1.p1  ORF type:complete len:317 (-),score=48.90 TRINITY_DN24914_c0_g2_i1:299-1168(-)